MTTATEERCGAGGPSSACAAFANARDAREHTRTNLPEYLGCIPVTFSTRRSPDSNSRYDSPEGRIILRSRNGCFAQPFGSRNADFFTVLIISSSHYPLPSGRRRWHGIDWIKPAVSACAIAASLADKLMSANRTRADVRKRRQADGCCFISAARLRSSSVASSASGQPPASPRRAHKAGPAARSGNSTKLQNAKHVPSSQSRKAGQRASLNSSAYQLPRSIAKFQRRGAQIPDIATERICATRKNLIGLYSR